MHFYAWKAGLKTGMYYLRTRPKADAIQFTVDQEALKESRGIPGAVAPTAFAAKPVLALPPPASSPGPTFQVAPLSPAASDSVEGSETSSTDSSRVSTPMPSHISGGGGFMTPINSRLACVALSAAPSPAAAELAPAAATTTTDAVAASLLSATPAAGSPGTVGVDAETARLMALAAAKAEERRRMRAELDAYDAGADMCLNCGS